MKQTILFTGKELKELWKTYKFLILCAVLLLFGMSSPLLAKLTPELFSQIDLGLGTPLQLPDATFLDAYVQFFKNMTQICLIVLVLVLSGTIPHELKSGTAMLMLSKGLSRHGFILSKYTASLLCWSVSYALSAAVCFGSGTIAKIAGNGAIRPVALRGLSAGLRHIGRCAVFPNLCRSFADRRRSDTLLSPGPSSRSTAANALVSCKLRP